MRTTINIDDEVYKIARSIAEIRGISIGEAVSELMKKGLDKDSIDYEEKNGIPVVQVPKEAPPITPEDVHKDNEEAE